jgi:hypothetical protein
LTPTVRICNYKFSAPWPVASRDFVIIAGEKITVCVPPLRAIVFPMPFSDHCVVAMQDDGLFVTVVNSIERDDIPVEDVRR